jgi:hypothetical protein
MIKRVYKTMQGREVDIDALRSKNETMPAVGNAKMNARGDELGAGGKIIRTREESVAVYYEDNPNAKGPVNSTPDIQKLVTPPVQVEQPITSKKK